MDKDDQETGARIQTQMYFVWMHSFFELYTTKTYGVSFDVWYAPQGNTLNEKQETTAKELHKTPVSDGRILEIKAWSTT